MESLEVATDLWGLNCRPWCERLNCRWLAEAVQVVALEVPRLEVPRQAVEFESLAPGRFRAYQTVLST